MKIQSINSNIISFSASRTSLFANSRIGNLFRINSKNSHVQNGDTCEFTPEAKLKSQSKQILSRFRKFDISSYNSLSKAEKAVLRKTSSQAQDAADKTIKMGLKLKEHLDKQYGEDKYVFVSIGTSPSGIGRVMEFSGVETKYLPISGLKHYYEDDAYKEFEEDFPEYIEFLAEQGLTKEKMSNSDKVYLFYDYTLTGKSLAVFQKMMREDFDLDNENMKFKSLDYECYSASTEKNSPAQYAFDYVKEYITDEKIAGFGGVPHLPIWEICWIEECKHKPKEMYKRFNFLVIDALHQKKMLKENPANKNSL